MVNIKTLKHSENLLKVSNVIKQYVKMQLLNLINATFPNESCNKIMKIKNDAFRTTYRKLSVKNIL